MAQVPTYIRKLNVVRFETLLMRETEAEKRATLSALLAEEKLLLAEALQGECTRAAFAGKTGA